MNANGSRPSSRPISRVPRSHQEARRTYDALSRWYDILAGTSEQPYVEMGLQALEASPREQVLEVGFGTGDALLSFAESVGATGEVWGIDISTEMASVARQKLAQESPLAQVRLLCGDGLRLPLQSDCYDALFMSFTLELFDTPIMPKVLVECRRVLRHTGRLGIVSLSKSESPGLMERLYESAHRLLPRLVDCRPIFTRSVLEDAGFVIVDETRRRMWGLPVDIVVARCPG